MGRLGEWVVGSVVLALLLTTSASAQKQPATVIIVRHAEKAAEPAGDPPLSDIGRARAAALLEAVRDAGISVIYATPKLRNLETARFVADSLHVPIVQVPIESGKLPAHMADVVARVKKNGGGRVSLVVEHSNTTPMLIKAFGGPDVGEIVDPRYDDLFVLTMQDGKKPKLVRAKYGQRWTP
jgi:broad specificity phosphatase PhoE